MNKQLNEDKLQMERDDAEDFVKKVLKKMNPEQKRRALDIMTGFSLVLMLEEKPEKEKSGRELQEV
ncbi:hypothetical protein DXC97_02695 [Lachnospiraceae bacterium TF09-5]|nr:hypothetical protein DXC97_02695 [Lachnospiraceae bacterium TF09-5]